METQPPSGSSQSSLYERERKRPLDELTKFGWKNIGSEWIEVGHNKLDNYSYRFHISIHFRERDGRYLARVDADQIVVPVNVDPSLRDPNKPESELDLSNIESLGWNKEDAEERLLLGVDHRRAGFDSNYMSHLEGVSQDVIREIRSGKL